MDLLVALVVGANLSVPEIIRARDYSLAEAARPALGSYGVWFTVAIAILATASGLIASVFAVSRMIAMLTDMDIIPHRHFGMSGTVQRHTLVYTVVAAAVLAVLFDLSRIASLDSVALAACPRIKFVADPLILWVALGGIILVFGLERLFLGTRRRSTG